MDALDDDFNLLLHKQSLCMLGSVQGNKRQEPDTSQRLGNDLPKDLCFPGIPINDEQSATLSLVIQCYLYDGESGIKPVNSKLVNCLQGTNAHAILAQSAMALPRQAAAKLLWRHARHWCHVRVHSFMHAVLRPLAAGEIPTDCFRHKACSKLKVHGPLNADPPAA